MQITNEDLIKWMKLQEEINQNLHNRINILNEKIILLEKVILHK